jgi:hypothetical protein
LPLSSRATPCDGSSNVHHPITAALLRGHTRHNRKSTIKEKDRVDGVGFIFHLLRETVDHFR